MTVYDFICEHKHDYACSYDHDRWKLTMNHVHWRSLHDSEQSCHDNSKALKCTLCMLTSDILMQIWFAISEGELPHFPAFSPSISGGESELPQFPLLNKASEAGTESAPSPPSISASAPCWTNQQRKSKKKDKIRAAIERNRATEWILFFEIRCLYLLYYLYLYSADQ